MKIHAVFEKDGYEHTHTVVLLHGDGHVGGPEFARDFFVRKTNVLGDRPKSLRDVFPTIRWVFPSAPRIRSERTGETISQWFDTWSTSDPDEKPEIQVPGLSRSIETIQSVLEHEEKYIPYERIFLGGFGHGFAAAYSAYFLGKPFAGLIGLSTWAPLNAVSLMPWKLAEIENIVCQQELITPIFISHSRDNQLLPVEHGRRLCDLLRTRTRARVEYHEYEDGGARMDVQQALDDLAVFLNRTAFHPWPRLEPPSIDDRIQKAWPEGHN
ncbi:alpha/beta-hydrolase [Annulohypoxylon bovei var. microspora]|nr:alpha/beta-hydrolase [Annulohypoxylon bovei var. microspora]